ncbi:alpha/beta hydrolase [Pseudosulfitobacter koreensis]|uniref:Alpha/beta hydrolase n=1 Tax=Pseudosulfitobacter koreensis TaxID=2968472 RepID=A0ABT1Z3K0_9RHOB|nr:alpha/beta hydrolase [Pseudosulfitobacter koreense]MCR8827722.1 alpha/beta hydrolase [Pseudosulfitobacter koreense]
MSWQRSVLNNWLTWFEKPAMARAASHDEMRRRFESSARLFFHGPRDVARHWRDLGSGEALWLEPKGADAGQVLLYFHGGGYIFGSPRTHAAMVAALARRAGLRAVLPVYPLAPEAPYPAALDRAEDAYHALVASGVSPQRIIMGGDSAGGGLVLALLARLIQCGADLPAGVFAFSPLTDLTFSGASLQVNARCEAMLPTNRVSEMAEAYLHGTAPTDPQASPLFADFKGAPPTWIAAGDTEILLDDTRRLVPRMKAQGVSVQMHIAHDVPHVWPMFHNTLPEARQTLDQLAGWIRTRLAAAGES